MPKRAIRKTPAGWLSQRAPMATQPIASRILRFDGFELDVRAGEVRRKGVRLRLRGQPLHVLEILLERAGDLVTREELQSRIWPADTSSILTTACTTPLHGFAKCWAIRRRTHATSRRCLAGATGTSAESRMRKGWLPGQQNQRPSRRLLSRFGHPSTRGVLCRVQVRLPMGESVGAVPGW